MKFQRNTYLRTEADLVAEFFHQARLAGLEVYLEVYLPSTMHRSGQMRVDAIVVSGDEVICCVEAKAHDRPMTFGTRQDNAYRSLEYNHRIQTIWINNFAGIPAVVASIAQLVNREDAARKAS